MNLQDGKMELIYIWVWRLVANLLISTTIRPNFSEFSHREYKKILNTCVVSCQSFWTLVLLFHQSCTVQILGMWSTPPGLYLTLNSWWGQPFSIAAILASFCKVVPPLPAMAVSQGRLCGHPDYPTVFVSIRALITFPEQKHSIKHDSLVVFTHQEKLAVIFSKWVGWEDPVVCR